MRLPAIFRRSAEPNSWAGTAHPVTMASIGVSHDAIAVSIVSAENLAVVLACVNVISSNIAAFPVLVYRRQGAERIEVADHWLTRFVRYGPNPDQVWGALIESAVASVELHGNALLEILRDPDGTITGLRFIPWAWVVMQLLPSGRVAFDVYQPALPGGRSQAPVARRRRDPSEGPQRRRHDRPLAPVPRARRAAHRDLATDVRPLVPRSWRAAERRHQP